MASDVASALEEKLAAARGVARTLADRATVDSIYIGGSITAGLGNATSDVDVFAILAPGHQPPSSAQQLVLSGHRIDVEWHAYDRLVTAPDVLTTEIRRDALAALWRLDDELDFICRLSASEVVMPSPTLEQVRSTVAGKADLLRRLLASRWGLEVNTHLEDFVGACLRDDLDSAAYIGQSLLAAAGKALAAASGDYYFGRKWVYRQLARSLGGSYPIDTFRRFQTGAWLSEGRAGAEALLNFAQTTVAVAQLLALHGADPELWPVWERGSAGIHRSPHYLMIGLTEGILLHQELGKQFVIRPEVALVWTLCDGRDPAAVARLAAECAGLLPGSGPTESRAAAIVDTLAARGLVATGPSSALTAAR